LILLLRVDERIPELEGLDERIPELEGLDDRIPELEGLDDRIPELDGLDERIPELEGLDEVLFFLVCVPNLIELSCMPSERFRTRGVRKEAIGRESTSGKFSKVRSKIWIMASWEISVGWTSEENEG
jgi:hypothetical protein